MTVENDILLVLALWMTVVNCSEKQKVD